MTCDVGLVFLERKFDLVEVLKVWVGFDIDIDDDVVIGSVEMISVLGCGIINGRIVFVEKSSMSWGE